MAKTTLNMRIETRIKEQLQEQAKEAGMSVTGYIHYLILQDKRNNK